ncbi:uncharacterized protein A1O9_05626 [Exophiala aquamarina CBS 119918]|uniref:Shugoshin C-terminal domain-containing protein n=1 Tax=Exophiala aquamarina CBS 119918 TaxID=1182545 RepID=A0A072PEJ6_9EURO|nr:uncharacterized protein A1O9_05626 [Exophiala aquamarina CBS 119918]KEF57708.1 hypothetical protein A1O9_05626 [Exophiala aquamarina CBS 119918]
MLVSLKVLPHVDDRVPLSQDTNIGIVKRRFIRQNREIARVNSNQSQRIRNLEIEISRVIAENATLRQQVIAAQAEAERWQQTNGVNHEILELKDRLERKLKDVVELVGEMTEIPAKSMTSRHSRRRSRVDNLNTLSETDWKNRSAMRELSAKERGDGLDGRLPSILENKTYPRRSLEVAEVVALKDEAVMQDSTESPDLGPPPVAHLDVQEPITFNASRSSGQEVTDEVSQLPSTLERRRRRRTSALLQDMPREDEAAEQQLVEAAPPQLLKVGAKRKLEASELEEPLSRQSRESDEFIFQRRRENVSGLAGGRKTSRFARPPGRENDPAVGTTTLSPEKIIAPRKILAPKTTNSPAKRKVQIPEKLVALEDSREVRMDQEPVKPSRRTKIPPALGKRVDSDPLSQDLRTDDLQPKTPAFLSEDMFSPVSTEPSARTTLQKTEAAVLNSVEDVLNGSIGRGSRRARAAISYAEPSLRDKMRRPGKELVGAVEGLDKNREMSISHSRATSLDRARSDGEGEDLAKIPVNVKRESSGLAEDRWKELPHASKKEEPASPLRDKERGEKVREAHCYANSRRDAAYVRDSSKKSPSSASVTTQDNIYAEDLENAVDRLSIFDPPVSSPLDDPKSPAGREQIKVVTTAAGSKRKTPATASSALLSRRHSIQPSSSLSNLSEEAGKSGRLTGTSVPPRPNSAATLRNESSAAAGVGGGLKRSGSAVGSLRNARSNGSRHDGGNSIADRESAGTAAVDGRAERTAMTRRRSMMV